MSTGGTRLSVRKPATGMEIHRGNDADAAERTKRMQSGTDASAC